MPTSRAELKDVFAALKKLLRPYARRLRVTHDAPGKYYLASKTLLHRGKPLFVAAVVIGKRYVSYHFIPIYADPNLGKSLSPELKRRKQGKACFNFTSVDPVLFRELSALTRKGLSGFRGLPVS
jgi:hypothetical protein